jgi:hypothetical protein
VKPIINRVTTAISGIDSFAQVSKGSRKDKVAIFGVEVLGQQGAKRQEYLYIPSFRNLAGRDASVSKM